ncbi:hypothetical protein ACTA71_006112 [Dictyostelium dimigraforme]
MENKENTLNGVIPKPKIRIVKKVIRKKPPMTPGNGDSSTNILNEQLSNLKLDNSNNNNKGITSTTTTNTTNTTTLNKPNVQKKSDILKKSIKEKIHFDKLTYDAQMSLIEDETTENELKTHYYNLFQPDHYKDVVAERSASGKCGYPCCGKPLGGKKLNQKYLISVKEQKVYNVEELSMFCSSDCLVKSKLYASTLDETAVYLRNVESKKILPTEETLISSQIQSQQQQTQAQQPPKPVEFLNKFEKSLVITENENASLIPPNLTFDKNIDNEKTKTDQQKQQPQKPTTKTSTLSTISKTERESPAPTTTTTNSKNNKPINKSKKKIIITDDLKVPIEKKELKIRDSDDEDDDSGDLDYYSEDDDTLLGDEQDDVPMVLNEDEDEEDKEEDYNDEEDNKSDKSEDEFSLFRPTQISGKRIEELFKPHISNYHMVYSALSQFTTKHTNNFLQFNKVNYEYILEQNLQIKTNLHSQLSLVYQSVIDDLGFKITTAKEKVTMLIDTFKFDKPVPSLRRNHWKMLILVFLKSLSSIDEEILKDIQNNNDKFEKLVKECSFDMETLKVFQDLLIQGYQ